MPDKAIASVKVHADGRVYVPKQTRDFLDITGREARVELEIEVVDRAPTNEPKDNPVES